MSDKLTKNRSAGMDFLRFVCTFLVICAHVRSPWREYVLPLTRTTVPVFAMITGYYYSGTDKPGRKFRQIKKILVITVASELVYIFGELILNAAINGRLASAASFLAFAAGWLHDFFLCAPERWLNYLAFNNPPSGPHLWYMSAILYTLVFVAITERFMPRRKLYFLIPVLLGANLVLGAYSVPLLGIKLELHLTRNFPLYILPYFLLGDFLRSCKSRITLSNFALCVILTLSLLMAYAETLFLKVFYGIPEVDMFVSSVFSSVSALLLCARELPFFSGRLVNSIAELGKKYSTGLYITHILVYMSMDYIENLLRSLDPSMLVGKTFISPVSVTLLTLLLLWLYKSAESLLKAGKSGAVQRQTT